MARGWLIASAIVVLLGIGAFLVAPTARDCLYDALMRCGENDGARYLRAAGTALFALAGVLALVGLIRGQRGSLESR